MAKTIFASLSSAALFLLSLGVSWADESTTPATTSFDIPPQNLEAALIRFSEQSDIQLVMASANVDGKQVEGVVGDLTHQEALAELLDNTGLEYQFVNDETVAIGVADERGVSDSKNLTPTPVLMAQNQMSQAASTETSNRNSEGGTSIITGEVTDARTGANLKGAKVTIEEAGQWTSTNDLGEFRFVNVPTGSVTLTVSYLGYAGQSATISVYKPNVSTNFALRGGSEIEEIVVFGQRSARAQALNIERTAPNTRTVVNADLLGSLNGDTISDTLRRVPGVAFVPDETTGEGANVIVRGVQPDLNQVQVNGVRLLDGTGLGRSPDLSNILTESIESVTINKSLLPSQDSNGAGGLIEIETKSPLDRDERFASVSVEYGETSGVFGDEFEFGGTLSRIFGSRQDFGLSVSGSYRERELTRINYDIGLFDAGQFLPLDEDGNQITFPNQIDLFISFPFDTAAAEIYPRSTDASQSTVNNEVLSLTGTVEKQFGSHTNLRLDITYNERSDENYTSTTSVSSNTGYDPVPITELGGEERWALVVEDIFRNQGLGFLFGDGIGGLVTRSASYTPAEDSESTVLSFRGDTDVDRWSFDYGLGYTVSESRSQADYSYVFNQQDRGPTGLIGLTAVVMRDDLNEQALDNTTSDGRLVSIFAPLTPEDESFVLPLFNDAGFAFFNDVDELPIQRIVSSGARKSEAEAVTLDGSARRAFERGPVSYIEVGANYQDTSFIAPGLLGDAGTGSRGSRQFALNGTLPSEIGLRFSDNLLSAVGAQGGFLAADRRSIETVSGRLDDLVASSDLTEVFTTPIDNRRALDTGEEALSIYLESQLAFGNFELIGGVRVERIEVGSTSFLAPDLRTPDGDGIRDLEREEEVFNLGEFVSESVTQTEYLPRFLANYRFDENLILRGAYYTTVSRPQLSNLTQFRNVRLDQRAQFGDSGTQQQLEINQGNPDLKPARTHNFSADIEWYDKGIGVIKASLFYKSIQDSLQSNRVEGDLALLPDDLVLPDLAEFNDLPDNLNVTVTTPVNSDDEDTIWGLELAIERQLSPLHSYLDGFGVFANYTYTDSESARFVMVAASVDEDGFVVVDGIPFDDSPEHQGTFGFTYNRNGIDGSILYTYQDRRLSRFRPNGLSTFNEEFDTLDFIVSYATRMRGADMRFFLTGEDLLRGRQDAFLRTSIGGQGGVPVYYTGATYLGGRTISVGVAGSF